jgi:hypothetical protein
VQRLAEGDLRLGVGSPIGTHVARPPLRGRSRVQTSLMSHVTSLTVQLTHTTRHPYGRRGERYPLDSPRTVPPSEDQP